VSSKEEVSRVLAGIADASREYWRALAMLAAGDKIGRHDQAIVESLEELAIPFQPTSGTPHNRLSVGLRYLPVVTALEILFVAGVAAKAGGLLRRIAAMTVEPPDAYTDPEHISEVMFALDDARDAFQTQHPGHPRQRWCEPLGTHIRPLVESALVGARATRNMDRAFYSGEFTMALLPLSASAGRGYRRGLPAPGNYLYYSAAARLLPRFIREERELLEQVYGGMLRSFDERADRIVSSSCMADGFSSGAEQAAYPDAMPTKEPEP